MSDTWISSLPPCPYCGHRWHKKEPINSLVAIEADSMELAITCPCKGTVLLLWLTVRHKAQVDVEGSKHYPNRRETIHAPEEGNT